MRTINKVTQKITCSLFLITCYLLSGCDSLLNTPQTALIEQGYGTVTINFSDSAARTIFPSTVFEKCVYTFYNQSNGDSTIMLPGPDGAFALLPGSWSVEVEAYGDPSAANDLAATGVSEAFTVTAGHNTQVTVPLTGKSEAGEGTFKYRIRYPEGTTVRDFTIVKLPDMAPVSFSVPAGGGTEINGTVSNMPAGFYLASLRLLHPDGVKGAGKNQVVHIYNALTSEFGTEDAPIVFADEDFAFLPLPAPLAPTVTVSGAGQLSVSWAAVTGAEAYELWYGTSPIVGSAEKWGADINAAISAATITGLGNPTYYVWIRAKNKLGPGDFSPAARGLFTKSIAAAADLAKIGMDADWPLSGNYALAADIVLENWVPIGAGGAFSGDFDGDGNTITIKSFDAVFMSANSSLGVFASVGGSATAKARIGNLTVHSELNHTLSNNRSYSVGAVTGQSLPYSLCESITVTGSLVFSGSGFVSAGGVAGSVNGGEITGCAVTASLTMSGSSGGGTYCYAGGVAGKFEGGAVITDCHSSGDVSGASVVNILVGGIAGGTIHPWSGGDTKAYYGKFENCSSSGAISASGGAYWSIAGGIVGHINGDGSKSPGAGRTRVVRCYATGTVTGEGPSGSWPYVGGIVGQNQSAGLVSQCYFTGTVTGTGAGNYNYTGGIIGYNVNGGIVEDCWSAGTVNGRINAGGIVGQNLTGALTQRCYSTAAITVNGAVGERGSASGHGAGGIAGYNQSPSGVSNCAALNPSIASAGFELMHRVVGTITGNPILTAPPGTQTNNRAWEGMAISAGNAPITPDEVGSDSMDGQGIAQQKPGLELYRDTLGWDFAGVWKMGGGGYPVLLACDGGDGTTGVSDIYTPGSYAGSAPSVGGDITASVSFSATQIVGVTVVSQTDTLSASAMEAVIAKVSQDIIAAQSTSVDTVTGATVSSSRIMNAVEDCAEQARIIKNGPQDTVYQFFNNSGYTIEVTADGRQMTLEPGAYETVARSETTADFTVTGGWLAVVRETARAIFYNGGQQP
jgi:uncharacterized protein with FMN-binding domain